MQSRVRNNLLFFVLNCMLSGCIFEIESLYNYDYPIQPDGSVDLTLAPMADIHNFTMKGIYIRQFGSLEIQSFCEDELAGGGVPGNGYRPLSDNISTNSQSIFRTGADPQNPNAFLWPACLVRETSDENYEVKISVRAEGFWLPILSEDNMDCIVDKVLSEKLHYLTGLAECLSVDARATGNSLGLNPSEYPPQEINVLKVKIPPEYLSYWDY